MLKWGCKHMEQVSNSSFQMAETMSKNRKSGGCVHPFLSDGGGKSRLNLAKEVLRIRSEKKQSLTSKISGVGRTEGVM